MKFPYPRLQYGIRVLVLTSLALVNLYLLAAPEVYNSWTVGTIAACLLGIILVSSTPLFTSHEISDTGIRLRQGLLLDTTLKFEEIQSVSEIYVKIWTMGLLPLGARGRIVLANGNRNLVSIQLKARKRFPMLLWRSSREIIIDLNNPAEFMKMVNERLQR